MAQLTNGSALARMAGSAPCASSVSGVDLPMVLPLKEVATLCRREARVALAMPMTLHPVHRRRHLP
eukprot:3106735-Pyramimonas_sp.AAC.1